MNHPRTLPVVILCLAALTTGCASPPVNVRLDWTLSIIEPRHDFATLGFSGHWSVVGETGNVQPVVRTGDDGLFLEIQGGQSQFAALRPLDARLLATPFLTWRWRLSQTPSRPPPMRLAVGFLDGDGRNSSFSPKGIRGGELPGFSRSLTIAWGQSALQRGTLDVRPGERNARPVAKYYARGGRENLGKWWSEALDLSALHAKAWPKVDMRETRIVFAGLVMMAGTDGSHAHLADYRLSR